MVFSKLSKDTIHFIKLVTTHAEYYNKSVSSVLEEKYGIDVLDRISKNLGNKLLQNKIKGSSRRKSKFKRIPSPLRIDTTFTSEEHITKKIKLQ